MEYCEYDYDCDFFYDAFSLNYPVNATSISSVTSDQNLYLSDPDSDDPDFVSDVLSNHRPFLLSDHYDWFEGNDDYSNFNEDISFGCNWNDFEDDDIHCDIRDDVISGVDGIRLSNSGVTNGVDYGRIDQISVPTRSNFTNLVDEINGRSGTRLNSVLRDDLSSRVNNVNVHRSNFRVLDDVMNSGRDDTNTRRSVLGVAGNVTDLNGARLTSGILNDGRLNIVEGRRVDFRVLDDENELYAVEDEGGVGYGYGFEQRAELGESSGGGGLRVVGIDDSESEFEEEDFEGSQLGEHVGDSLNMNGVCLEEEENLELEWEEVDEMERERLNAVINGVGEFSLSSEFSLHEDTDEEVEYDDDLVDVVRNVEWDILLNVGELERNHDFGGVVGGANSYLDIADAGSTYTAEIHTPFDQFMEDGITMRPGPPAAKMVVQNLPEVELRNEDIDKNAVACAVCMEGISDKEKVRKLPCSHYYHGDCIFPWLKIRNTCPVCRHELPTDDLDYERHKNHSAAFG